MHGGRPISTAVTGSTGCPRNPPIQLIASARESDQPYIISQRGVQDTLRLRAGDGRHRDGPRGRRDRPADRPGHHPARPGLGRLRGPSGQPALESRARLRIGRQARPIRCPTTRRMADGRFRLVVPPGRGFLVAYIQYQSDRYVPAGVPPKGRPAAPADALEMHYDTVPFQLFTQNFPAVQPIDIAPGTESITCDLTFDSGVARTGTVLDPEGRPLAGASMIGADLPQ